MVVRLIAALSGGGPGAAAVGTFADVGCGRGELALALVRDGIARRAVCGDNRPGAVRAARELALALGLAGAVEVRLGDGLSVLAPGEADAIAIAGLGGQTIAEILEAGRAVAARARLLVLQPVRAAGYLRAWAAGAGAEWLAEDLVREGGRFYPALALRLAPEPPADRARAREAAAAELAARAGWPEGLPRDLLWTVGPLVWCERHRLLAAFLAERADRASTLAGIVARAGGRRAAARAARLAAEGEALRALLTAWEGAQGFVRRGTNGGEGG